MSASKVVLNRETLVPVGLAITIGASLLVGGWTASRAFGSLESEIARNRDTLEAVRMEVVKSTGSRWTADDMRVWVSLLRAQNPALKVPDTHR